MNTHYQPTEELNAAKTVAIKNVNRFGFPDLWHRDIIEKYVYVKHSLDITCYNDGVLKEHFR